MKAIDFTKPGGFPLTQDQLGYLQSAYTEGLHGLAAVGSNGGAPPVLLSGMVATIAGGTTTVSAGWFYYNGEMVRFTGGSYGTPGVGLVPLVVISAGALPLTFNDGSNPNVILEKTASLTLATAVTDATHFPLSILQPFGVGFGKNNREQTWRTLAVSTDPSVGGVSGTIYYKKDFTANTLQIRGLLFADNAQNFVASPGTIFYIMGTLPAGYIPANNAYFISNYFVATSLKDDLGVAWIRQVNGGINTTGQLYINWIRPDAAMLGYGINFNTIIPLD